jgi:predicted nucleic acid-binding protein
MPVVVDASVTISLYLADESDIVADSGFESLGSRVFLVPAIWWFEVRNGLVTNERRGRLDPAHTIGILAHLDHLPIRIDREPDGGTILTLARAHRLTFYDAAYLELALRAGAPLATLDRALAAAARAAGVPLVGEAPA